MMEFPSYSFFAPDAQAKQISSIFPPTPTTDNLSSTVIEVTPSTIPQVRPFDSISSPSCFYTDNPSKLFIPSNSIGGTATSVFPHFPPIFPTTNSSCINIFATQDINQQQHQPLNGDSNQQQQQQDQHFCTNEEQDQLNDNEKLRQCISQVMKKKQNIQSSSKRKDILAKHRNLILEATMELIQQGQFDSDYNTTEEFELLVSQNIDKWIREHEEEELRRIEYDEELNRVEEEYFRNQLMQYEQELEELNLKSCEEQSLGME